MNQLSLSTGPTDIRRWADAMGSGRARPPSRTEPLLTVLERGALQGTPWFTALPAVVRHDILRHCDVRRYAHDQVLVEDRGEDLALSVVSSGAVRLAFGWTGAPALDFLPQGAWFVDPAMFGGRAPLYACTAHGSTTIASVRGDRLSALVVRHPSLHAALMALSHERIAASLEIFEGLSTLALPARVARCLLRLAGSFGRPEGGATRIALPLKQGVLAEMVRSSRQRLNQELKGLEAEGIVRVRREIVVIRPDALRAQAVGHEV